MKKPAKPIDKALGLFQANQHAAALKEIRALLRIRPDNFEALQLCGAICSELGRHEEALHQLSRAARLYPSSAPAHYNLGNAQMIAGEIENALQSFTRGLKLEPREPLLLCASANALTELKRFEEAFAQFRLAIGANERFADAHYGLGRALMLTGAHALAKDAFHCACQLDPSDRKAQINSFICGLEVADWENFETHRALMRAAALEGVCENPFHTLLLFDEPDLHLKTAKCALDLRRASSPLAARPPRAGRRIRVGYFSSDFRQHPTSRLLAGMIEHHDRSAFEILGISIGGDGTLGAIGQRIRGAFDRFIDMGGANDEAIRDAVRELDIDIAVDLMGHTQEARPSIFRPRVAPVQMNYLGYPGTTGNTEMDYVVIDPIIAETFEPQHFTERPLILPHCYQPNDDRRPAPATPLSRAEYGLPPDAFVFCCFNEPRKVAPEVFDSWMRILGGVERSVLWLYTPRMLAAERLRAEAQKRGVDPSRLIFCDRVNHEEHLARYAVADLFLDTFPYTAHTTASDALWMRCPVLTRMGNSFQSRVAGSILTACGLSELVAHNTASFERTAHRLATITEDLASIRERLGSQAATHALFDTKAYTTSFEAALQTVWARRPS